MFGTLSTDGSHFGIPELAQELDVAVRRVEQNAAANEVVQRGRGERGTR